MRRSKTESPSPTRSALAGSSARLSVAASIVRASQRSSTSRARSSRNGSRVRDASAFGGEVRGPLAEASVAQDLDVSGEERRISTKRELAGTSADGTDG